MKIIKAYPPNFAELRRAFPIAGRNGIIFAWGDILYNPGGKPISPELLAHEAVHGHRQKQLGIEAWWRTYVSNREVRLLEEVLAHKAELAKFRETHPAKEHDGYRQILAARLASAMYGGMVSQAAALEAL